MFSTRPWEVEFELAWFFVIHFHFKTMCNAILTHFIFKTDVRYYFFCSSSTYPENYIYLLETDKNVLATNTHEWLLEGANTDKETDES